jgi:hypothetical protein
MLLENSMLGVNKNLIIAGFIITFVPLSVAVAGVATPGIDQRQINQERRIDKGVESGRLTGNETQKLENQQNRIENAEAKAKADGVVTGGERRRLTVRQNKASRNIYRKKHNRRHP